MFHSPKSFLAFLLAVLTIYSIVRAFKLSYALEPAIDLWKRLGSFGRVIAIFAIVFLSGYAVSKEMMRASNTLVLPNWFTVLCYDTTDTDSDGIPDCWERWTRTNPVSIDSSFDSDEDGVNNITEFQNQCDPMLSDTDGDGYSDKIEIEGQVSGKTWFNPIVKAVYDYEELDANTNGVPDRWENSGYVYGYRDVNGDGLPDGVSFPESGDDNFDVEVIVSTTRSALLSWGASKSEGFVLPPCSCLTLRLRLSALSDTDVNLSCETAGSDTDGLWYGRIIIRWPEDTRYTIDENRIQIRENLIIECDTMETSFRGEVGATVSRSARLNPSIAIRCNFQRVYIGLIPFSNGCWEHDTNSISVVAEYANIEPPFVWYVNECVVEDWCNDYLPNGILREYITSTDDVDIRCDWGVTNSLLSLTAEYSIGLFHCLPSTTNIIGAAWHSTHNPEDPSDHTPYYNITSQEQYSEYCPVTYEHTYCVGWDHQKVNSRNLPVIETGDERDTKTDHCIGIVGKRGDIINLYDFLDMNSYPNSMSLRFRINNEELPNESNSFIIKSNPDDLNPKIFFVEIMNENSEALDNLWIVVSCKEMEQLYSEWKVSETNLEWTLNLPKPFSSLNNSTNGIIKSMKQTQWREAEEITSRSYMHHNALYEMRSFVVDGGHGHQATYNADGSLIVSSIAAGSADKTSPQSIWNGSTVEHRRLDVHPYVRALQLDGNPILTDNMLGILTDSIPTRLSRPCLFQGNDAEAYLDRRPAIPTGVQ